MLMRAGRPAAAMKLLKALFLLFVCPARAIDNGLGMGTPSARAPRARLLLARADAATRLAFL